MAGEWQEIQLGDLVNQGALVISDGYRVRNEELGPTGIPFVRGGDIGDGWINTQTDDHIRPEFVDRVRGKLARPGDVAFITKGTVGRGGRLRDGQPMVVFAPQVAYWRVLAPDVLDSRFLFYLTRSWEFQSALDSVKTHGSMVADYVSISQQYDFAFRFPDIDTQRAIAHILGTLDDKIELNRRISDTLEAMARALFKSWFVDFDPVRAKAEGRDPGLPQHLADLFPDGLVDSELGEIPEGWRVTTIGQFMVNFDSKRVPLSGGERASRRGPYPYHGAAGVMDYLDDYLFDGIYALVGEDGSVVDESGLAVTQYVWGKLWVNNHAHVLQGRGAVSTEQLFLYFHFEPVAPYVTGAVQPKLSQGRMNAMPFLFPGDAICSAFGEMVKPWFSRVRASADETRALDALRDTLLPKLISGELRVPRAAYNVSSRRPYEKAQR